MKRLLTTLTVSVFIINGAIARYVPTKSGNNGSNNSLQAKAANCTPATARETLEQNNVSALIETGGIMWQDRSTSTPAYEVPVGSDEYYIYSGGLWMGGLDVNGQLKLAAQKFAQDGRDFWTGPLTTIPGTGNLAIGRLDYGPAEIEPDVCQEYDKFFYITKAEVTQYRAYFACTQDGDCDEGVNFPDYSIPSSIINWPAHGDAGRFQDFYLAPFFDANNNGIYDYANGDYPWYDLDKEIDCRASRKVTLYGDFTYWWVFNDKGNVHTESGGDQIGMEIRAQAFAFATNDEVNNMTFYNYEMINRSTQRLTETYFAVYVDADIGFADNDYVGCDVSRGVGYAYNGTANDAGGNNALGTNPGAIGVDFFEGPYQDNDGIDNPLTTDIAQALALDGIPYAGLGIGYGDQTIDNERLGMKRFVFYTRQDLAPVYGQDPTSGVPVEFYNYMRGIWRDNTPFTYGGNGHGGSVEAKYMFPGNSDPLFWGTEGIVASPADWSEAGESNPPSDRRFLEVAGPFTLEPGALNNITVGVVYGKTKTGDPFNSVQELLKADDKAQLLFDNCFRLIDGPSAPDLTAQELDQEVILYISNPFGSNNFQVEDEDYTELDNSIVPISVDVTTTYVLDTATGQYDPVQVFDSTINDRFYRFQGYQIYQLKNGEVGPDQLEDESFARLVAQVDVKDDVTQIVNYELDEDLGLPVPVEKVNGENEGIRHSFKVTEDKFALGNTRLINHKKYYYMAIAYGYNNFADYDPTTGSGQDAPYLPSRNTATGLSITPITVIPHIPAPELGGTVQLADYGYGPEITRVEGSGHTEGIFLEITADSELDIVQNYTPKRVTYKNSSGPIDIKVIDPLNVKEGTYELRFLPDTVSNDGIEQASWVATRTAGGEIETVESKKNISINYEQIIPEWGISVTIKRFEHSVIGVGPGRRTEFIGAEVVYTDSTKQWLSGVGQEDGSDSYNWVRSGTADEDSDGNQFPCLDIEVWNDRINYDDEEVFEGILGGTVAPFPLVRPSDCWNMTVPDDFDNGILLPDYSYIDGIDLVITSDKSKWTRVPVLETQDTENLSWDNNTEKLEVKLMPSRDKEGKQAGDAGYNAADGDFNGAQPLGMSWFPGYAIDVETGERLNMAFGEDSWLGNENGGDMLWNPTDDLESQAGDILFGGKHYIYVFKNARREATSSSTFSNNSRMPAYDQANFLHDKIVSSTSNANKIAVWRSCMWVMIPTLSESSNGLSDPSDPYSFIESDVKVKIRVEKEFMRHSTNNIYVDDAGSLGSSENQWFPMYEWDMEGISTLTSNTDMADSALALINVVPNPYYAYSNYEFNKLDNVVKIVNLPDQCTVRIYNVSGTLVRTFRKDSPITSVDWDLKNFVGIPIASGVYIIHVEVPDVGERVLKWFGVVRPPDLDF